MSKYLKVGDRVFIDYPSGRIRRVIAEIEIEFSEIGFYNPMIKIQHFNENNSSIATLKNLFFEGSPVWKLEE